MSQAVRPRTSISAVLLNAFCNRTSQEQAEADSVWQVFVRWPAAPNFCPFCPTENPGSLLTSLTGAIQ